MGTRRLVRFAGIAALALGLASGAMAGARVSTGGVSRAEARGDLLWVSRYNGPANRDDIASALSVGPGGFRVFVTGSSERAGGSGDYATVAYSASTGNQVWLNRYNGPGNGSDVAHAVSVSPDRSKVFVSGESLGSGSDLDYATVAYDAGTGARLWAKRYNGPGNSSDVGYALGVSPDSSRVYVTGGSVGPSGSTDYATVAYDAATGARLWVSRYKGSRLRDDAFALAVSPDGAKLYVTGRSWGSGVIKDDYATVAYDAATGAELWVNRYDGPASKTDSASAIGVSPDGTKVFVTGLSEGSGSGSDYATVAYDTATGTQLWLSRYDGPGSAYDAAHALGFSPDGSRVFVTGMSAGTGINAYDYATVAYDAATGAELWVKRYNGPMNSNDDARALVVGPDGSELFVTGRSLGSGVAFDYATVAYDAATGAELWTNRYDGPANGDDSATAVGLTPDGAKAFVTGSSDGGSTGADYATVAYSTG